MKTRARKFLEISEDIKSIESDQKKRKSKKINNSNNNNSNNSNDGVDIDGMNQTEISKLAKSLILIPNYNNLEETKDKIKSTLYQKKKLDKENCESSNPFNVIYGELKIKDNIEPIEYLFFKVFRNKYIFKQIFSNMDKLSTIAYESIMSINKMIKRDQISMLKDKVYRKQTLTDLDNLEEFFKYFKNDKTFIQLFFNNYRNDIYGMVLDIEIMATQVVYSDCKAALELLVEEYQFKPSLSFIISFTQVQINNDGSTKYIKAPKFKHIIYLLEHSSSTLDLNQKVNNKLINSILDSNSPKVIKLIDYLNSKKLIGQSIVLEIIRTLIQTKKDPLDFKLKYLFLIKTLIYKDGGSDCQDFNQKELNSYVYEPINYSGNKRESIKKLINEIYTLRRDTFKSLTYYLTYGIDEHKKISTHYNPFRHKKINRSSQSVEYGNFKVIYELSLKDGLSCIFKDNSLFDKIFVNLGEQESDREIKRNFIIELGQYIQKNQTSFNQEGSLNINFLVSLDDLELLQLFYKESGEFKRLSFSLCLIKSIQVLDYLFEIGQNNFLNSDDDICWMGISDLKLLKRIEELANTAGYQLASISSLKPLNDQVIQYISERPEIYRVNEYHVMNIDSYYYSETKFKFILKSAVQHLKQSKYNRIKFYKLDSTLSIKSIHHILNSIEFQEYLDQIDYKKYYYHYLSNDYNASVKDYISTYIKLKLSRFYENENEFLSLIIRKQDFNYLDTLLKEILSISYDQQQQENHTSVKNIIKDIIQYSYSKGYIKVIEFIHFNYTSVLRASTKNRIFTLDELREIVIKTEPKEFKILMYFLNIINLTKSQCKKLGGNCKYFELLLSNKFIK